MHANCCAYSSEAGSTERMNEIQGSFDVEGAHGALMDHVESEERPYEEEHLMLA